MAIEKIERISGVCYRAVYRIGGNKAPSKTFRRKIDAENWLTDQLTRRRQVGDHLLLQQKAKGEPICFANLYQLFHDEHALVRQAPSTVLLEGQLFSRFIQPSWGQRLVGETGAADVEELFRMLLKEGASSKRVNRVRTFLHGLFSFAVKRKLVESNPVKDVSPLSASKTTLSAAFDFLNQDETKRLLDWLKSSDPWLYPKVLTLVNTGIRYGEMVALTLRDLSFSDDGARLTVSRTYDRHTLTVRNQTKGNKARIIPLDRSMAVLLEENAVKTPPGVPLLWSSWEECRFPTKFNKHFQKALLAAGVKRIRIHDLRHSFAVHFLEGGGQLYDLQQLLGHTTMKLTERYSHFSKSMLERSRGIVNHHGCNKTQQNAAKRSTRQNLTKSNKTQQGAALVYEDAVPQTSHKRDFPVILIGVSANSNLVN